MRNVIAPMLFVVAVALPVCVFAQDNAPLTRTQVKAEVEQLKQVGYMGINANDLQYPDNLQAALRRAEARRDRNKAGN